MSYKIKHQPDNFIGKVNRIKLQTLGRACSVKPIHADIHKDIYKPVNTRPLYQILKAIFFALVFFGCIKIFGLGHGALLGNHKGTYTIGVDHLLAYHNYLFCFLVLLWVRYDVNSEEDRTTINDIDAGKMILTYRFYAVIFIGITLHYFSSGGVIRFLESVSRNIGYLIFNPEALFPTLRVDGIMEIALAVISSIAAYMVLHYFIIRFRGDKLTLVNKYFF